MTRIRMLIAALVAAAALPGAAAGAGEYVPFVTDFPAPQEPYVPFVSDFPRPVAPAPEPGPAPTGVSWGDVPLEGVGLTVAALLSGGALVLVRRRHAAPRLGGC
jgi:hypothetical protein